MLDADVVVVGIGVDPRTDLAAQLGLLVEPRGIVVDEHARTSDGLTVAAGDCAVGPNPFVRGLVGPTRLESVAHATDQARAAAATLAGRPAAYASVPWFWSDQGDLRLQMAGLPHGADHDGRPRRLLRQSGSRSSATGTGCSSPSSRWGARRTTSP